MRTRGNLAGKKAPEAQESGHMVPLAGIRHLPKSNFRVEKLDCTHMIMEGQRTSKGLKNKKICLGLNSFFFLHPDSSLWLHESAIVSIKYKKNEKKRSDVFIFSSPTESQCNTQTENRIRIRSSMPKIENFITLCLFQYFSFMNYEILKAVSIACVAGFSSNDLFFH